MNNDGSACLISLKRAGSVRREDPLSPASPMLVNTCLTDGDYRMETRVIRQIRQGRYLANTYTPKCLVARMNEGDAKAFYGADLYAAALATVNDWALNHDTVLYRYLQNLENQPLQTDYGVLSAPCDVDITLRFDRALRALGGTANQESLSQLLRAPDLFIHDHPDRSLDSLFMAGVANLPDLARLQRGMPSRADSRVESALTFVHGQEVSNHSARPPIQTGSAPSRVPAVDTIKALADQLHALHAEKRTHGNLTLATLKSALSRPETLAGLPDAAGSGFAAYEGFNDRDKHRLADALASDDDHDGISRKADNHMLLMGVIRLFAEQEANRALLDELEAMRSNPYLCFGYDTPQLIQWLDRFVKQEERSHVKDSLVYPLYFITEEFSLADALNWEVLRAGWVAGASAVPPEPSLPPSPPHDLIPELSGRNGTKPAVHTVDTIKALADQLQALHAEKKIHGNLTLATLKNALSRPETLAGLPDAAGSGFAAYEGFDEWDKQRLADALSRYVDSDGITRKADSHMLLDGLIRLWAEHTSNRTLLDELDAVKSAQSFLRYETPQLDQWLDTFVIEGLRLSVQNSIARPLFFGTAGVSLSDALNWEALRSRWTSGASEPVRPDVPEPQPEPSLPPSPSHDPIPGLSGQNGTKPAVHKVDTIKALADQLQALHAEKKIHGNLTLATLKSALSSPETLAGLPDAAGSGFAAYEGFGYADKLRLANAIASDDDHDGISRKADTHMLLVGVIRLFAEQEANHALLDAVEAMMKGNRYSGIGYSAPPLTQWLDRFVKQEKRACVKDCIDYPLFFSTNEFSLADALNWEALRAAWASEAVRPDVPEPQPEPSLPPRPPHEPIPGLSGQSSLTGSEGRRRLAALRSVFARLDALHREGRSHGALSDELVERAVALSADLDETGIPYAQRTDLNPTCAHIAQWNKSLSEYSWSKASKQLGERDIDWYYALNALVKMMPESCGDPINALSWFVDKSVNYSLTKLFTESYVSPGCVNEKLTLEKVVDWDALTAFLYPPDLDTVSVGTEPTAGLSLPVARLEREVARFDQWQRDGGYCHDGLSAAVLDKAIQENRPLGRVVGEAKPQPLYYPKITVKSMAELRNRESYAMLLSVMHWSSQQQSDWRLSHGLNYLRHRQEKSGESESSSYRYTVMSYGNETEFTVAVKRWITLYIKPEQRQQVLDGLESIGQWYGEQTFLPSLADSIDWPALDKSLDLNRTPQGGAVARLNDFSLENAPQLWRAACRDMELRNDQGHFDRDLKSVTLLERALDPSAFMLSSAGKSPVAPSSLADRVTDAIAEQKAWVNALMGLFELSEPSDPSGKDLGDSTSVDSWIESFVKRSHRAGVRQLMSRYSPQPVLLAEAIDWEALEQEWRERLEAPATLAKPIDDADSRLLFPVGDRSEQALLARAFPDNAHRLIANGVTKFRPLLVKNSLAEAIRSKDVPRAKACLLLAQDTVQDVASLKALAKERHDTGLVRYLKQQPYYGPGDPNMNLNCQLHFTVGDNNGDRRIVCRHLATELAMQGKQRVKDYATADGIRRILPNAHKAEDQWHRVYHGNSHAYHFTNDHAEEMVRRVVDTMNREGKTQKGMVIVTDNHAVALLIHKKIKDGMTYYALEYYDPNNTAVILRKTFSDPSRLRYSLSELMGRKESGYYDRQQKKPYQSEAYDVDTADGIRSLGHQQKIYCVARPAETRLEPWIVEQISRGTINWDDLADAQLDRDELEKCIKALVTNDYKDFGKHEIRLERKNRFLDTLLKMPAKYAGMLRWSHLDPDRYLAQELGERLGSSYRGGALPEFQP